MQYSKINFYNLVPNTFVLLLFVFLCVLPQEKAKAASLDVLTAAEDIGILSQSVVKNYFYVGENLNSSRSSQKLTEDILTIDSSLEILKASDDYEKIQDDLAFIGMIWNDLKETLAQEYSRDTGLLIIDMGEVLLEGSENVVKVLYDSDIKESDMVDVIENQRYLIERMAKLYIISIAGFKDFNVVKQTANTVQAFDEGLEKMELNNYSDSIVKKVGRLRKRWDSSRTFYLNVEKGDLPRTIFFNTEMIERLLANIFNEHKLI